MPDLTPCDGDAPNSDLAAALAIDVMTTDRSLLEDAIAAAFRFALRTRQLGGSFDDVRRLLEPLTRKGPTS